MAKELLVNASLIPASQLLSQTIFAIFDTVKAANEVAIHKENFKKFSIHLEKISFILKSLSKEGMHNPESLENAVNVLNREVKVAKQLVFECSSRSKVYLLINSRRIVTRLKCCVKDISGAVSLIALASLDINSGLNQLISELCQNMLDAEYETAAADEKILEKIEIAIQEGNVDRSFANQLLACIADAIGVSIEHASLKREFEELKNEMEKAKSRKDTGEALHMEQIIAVLEKADSITSAQEKEKKYLERRNSLGRRPLMPLQSFYCPISLDIMVDPVETSTGKTFERSAIEKWFAEGNNHCPLTMLPLDTSILRPNKTLKQSIQEWKDRNTIITIANIKSKLETNEEEEVLQSLDILQDLCLEREIHREWLKMENYFAVLIGLLGSKNREIRKRVLLILSVLAHDNAESKEDIAKVDNALGSIVRSLSRQIGESKLALELLLELSKSKTVCNLVGNIQGSILLLVTMLNSDDVEAAKNAHELLENLSFLVQNVIQMAKANYLKPLLLNLSTGPENMKIVMTETLSEIELTDQKKIFLVKNGVLLPLLQLLLNNDVEIKKVVVKALLQLSSLPENGLQMIKEGVVQPLLELLYSQSLQSPTLLEQVVATIMHLAISTTHPQAEAEQVSLLGSEEDIFKFFSLISLTEPEIQNKILKVFHALCQSLSGFPIRKKLRQISAAKVLVHLLELNTRTVRVNALKLFYCLTEDGDYSNFSSNITERFIKVLLTIIEASDDAEEMLTAMGIISKLPQESHITQWLLDSGAVQTILASLTDQHKHASHKNQVIENSVQALCRFTVSTNLEWQKRVAEEGIIPVLVQLLVSGTPFSKQNAAISIKQFSESSYQLSKAIKKPGIFKSCFIAHETGCPAHLGTCTVESSFCILQANALEPLVRMLAEQDVGTCEASLDALLTLLNGEALQSGSKVLADANAITPMIKLLSLPATRLQEKTLIALEQIFQLDEVKNKYKSMATMPLVDITQMKDSRLRTLAAKGLAQLGVLDKQSSYF
ncbi:U-box domain-containing protein 44-like [Gastrolobium bilobum]|uniref:U-box domain-containing protein 44-like n=1 Tax=Gastrolobium bilobum TaxID=150636 RepID=UPI002AB12BB6|nr:U-box domain-containing protein 44-like [Gastrolobium bilobum]XP_061352428.1 U-box domain-containing protein 44-like [Gastrolobium bilobum]XP_061352430.1 U-box domain-containing protein 44-like [Gastrolobium bilobum]